MVLQSKTSTTAALFVGELRDVSDLIKKDWVISLRVFEGSGKFYFTDETGEARLIVLAGEGVRELRSLDDFRLTGKKLRLCAADPAFGSGPKSLRAPSLTYQCSITTATREDSF
jgi:hypothetical protein